MFVNMFMLNIYLSIYLSGGVLLGKTFRVFFTGILISYYFMSRLLKGPINV